MTNQSFTLNAPRQLLENDHTQAATPRRRVIRQDLLPLLFLALWGWILAERSTRAPKAWRYVTEGMSRQVIYQQLGTPQTRRLNQAVWIDSRSFGSWQLRVRFEHEAAAAVEKNLEWIWQPHSPPVRPVP